LNKKIKNLLSIKKEAQKRKYWESARDCDFHLVAVKNQKALARYLYFGTPFHSYRQRILKNLDKPLIRLHENYPLKLGKGKKVFTINAITGEILLSSYYLKTGRTLHRLFNCIVEDFYRPKRVSEIFDRVFPGEFYSPSSSPDKVHQALKRLREFFRESKMPLIIEERNGSFRFVAAKGKQVRIIFGKNQNSNFLKTDLIKMNRRLIQLKQLLGGREFTTSNASQKLGLSSRATNYLLKSSLDSGQLVKTGKGPTTKYKFLD
jgi:hypothetical protein